MAEFGAKPCSHPGCRQYDFLTLGCSACGLYYCTKHFAISQHACSQGDAYWSSRRDDDGSVGTAGQTNHAQHQQQQRQQQSNDNADSDHHHPLSASKPSEVMAAVTSRFEGREGELNAETTHYNLAKAEDLHAYAGAPDKLLKSAQAAVNKATTAKEKRVSTQVHRMLLKSKAVGDKTLRMDDRFFLEVHYCGNEEDIHNLFFSRLWTVGRTLDEIVKARRRYLRLDPGQEYQLLELAAAGSPHGLPMGGVLQDLAPELESFDVVTVRPRSDRAVTIGTTPPPAVTTAQPGIGDTLSEKVQPPLSGGSMVLTGGAEPERSGRGADGRVGGKRREEMEGDGTKSAAAAAAAAAGAAALGASPKHMSITVGHGKTIYKLDGIDANSCSVLDLKRRLEPLTGVPCTRQKLLFKGVLKDTDKVASTKIVHGAKVMLLGGAK